MRTANALTISGISSNATSCTAPSGVTVSVLYHKVRESLGTAYNIVKVQNVALASKPYELNTASTFSVHIDFVSVDSLSSSSSVQGVIPREIAEILGLSRVNVGVRITRAKDQLLTLLKEPKYVR